MEWSVYRAHLGNESLPMLTLLIGRGTLVESLPLSLLFFTWEIWLVTKTGWAERGAMR